MSPSESQEEYEEVQAELRNRDAEYASSKQLVTDPETGVMTVINTKPPAQLPEKSTIMKGVTSKLENLKKPLYMLFSKVFVESFVLTFLAEWGDRSQMTTIVLAATKVLLNYYN